LQTSPKPSPLATAAQKAQEAQSSPEDSAEDEDPKDGDYIFEGGVESVDDDFDHREPEPSTSDDLARIKTEPTEVGIIFFLIIFVICVEENNEKYYEEKF
jgi:hypothetical protein